MTFRTFRLSSLHYGLFAAAITLLGAHVPEVRADTIDILATPPDINASVAPNVVMTFDDSGSMKGRHMGDDPPFNAGKDWDDGMPWGCAGVLDPRAAAGDVKAAVMNGVYYNPNVSYTPPVKADGSSFPNADATLRKVWLDGIAVNKPSGAVAADSSASVWSNVDSKSVASDSRVADFFDDVDESKVCIGGYDRRGNCREWGKDHHWTCDGNKPFDGNYADPDSGSKPTKGPFYYRLKSSVALTADTATGNPVETASVYDSTNWEAVAVPAAQYQNFANWYAYYRTRNLMARSAVSRAFKTVTDQVHIAWQNINKNTDSVAIANGTTEIRPIVNDSSASATTNAKTWRDQFYNWVFKTPANDGTPNRESVARAGEFFRYGSKTTLNATNPYWEPIAGVTGGKELTCRQNYHMLVTDGYWNSNNDVSFPSSYLSTPTYTTDQDLPDARKYSVSSKYSKVFWNLKKAEGSAVSPTMAELAFRYWATDLRPDAAMTNNVPPSLVDSGTSVFGDEAEGTNAFDRNEVYFNPVNDPATWQHMVQFMVGLGVPGNLVQDSKTLTKLRKGTESWWVPTQVADTSGSAQQAKIDDTWHAAVNSRGKYFNAGNPQALVDAITSILNNIVQRRGSATAVSVSTGVLNTGALAYSGGYDSGDWSGYLTGFSIDAASGAVGTAKWDAGCQLTGGSCKALGGTDAGTARAPGDRVIVTSSDIGKGNGVAFRWGSLGSTAQGLLNADGNGDKRVDYLRGDRSQEAAGATPAFRQRASVLGPVVNSQPVFVSYPDSGYRDDFPADSDEAKAAAADPLKTYEQFAYDHKDRPGTIYVGANDGMLHAFDAKTGKERWAYVPNTVLGKLNDYSKVGGGLVPSVDNTAVVRDVFIGGAWHTILVGTLRLGGRGVFALDVTNPDKIAESDASKLVLWESNATLTALANLGYTFGAPNIGRLPNGKWAVFVSGGYFPKDSPEATSDAAKRQQSSLFVLDAQTGDLIKELTTPSGSDKLSWGLASPVLGDYTDDQIDDAAFAGDIRGNLWRFDLKDWTVDQVFAPETAGDRPITVMPRLFPDPVTQRLIVVFGTGKYLGSDDRLSSTAKIQAFYGVREAGASSSTSYPASYYPVKQADLQTQTLNIDSKLRKLSDVAVDAKTQKGWTFALPQGERNVTTAGALFNSNRAILVTLKPSGDDPCDPNRKGAIMVVDAANGGPADGPPVLSGGSNSVSGTVVGSEVSNPPVGGSLPQVNRQGGGEIVLPGVVLDDGTKATFSVLDAFWRRRAWRELLQD